MMKNKIYGFVLALLVLPSLAAANYYGWPTVWNFTALTVNDNPVITNAGGTLSGNIEVARVDPNIYMDDTDSGVESRASLAVRDSSFIVFDADGMWSTRLNVPLSGTGNMVYNNSTVWTGANDGAGSGLDADYIDGKDVLRGTVTYDFPAIAAQGFATYPITVAGATIGASCSVGVSVAIPTGLIITCRVTTTGQAIVYMHNPTAGQLDPSSATYNVVVFNQ